MRFRELGPLRVRTGDGWVPVAAEKQRLLLAMLLANTGQATDADRLADALWGERPPRTVANTLASYVMRLRRLVGADVLITQGSGYELAVGDDDVDATVFQRLVTAGRRELDRDPRDAAAKFARALAMWRGDVFADVPASPPLKAHAAHLEQLRLTAQEDRAAALLSLGRPGEVVDELRTMVDDCPLRESRWALLMKALHSSGLRAEALAAYQRARHVLQDELGLEPGPQLRELQRILLSDDAPPVSVPELVLASPMPAQLPADVSAFTGRCDVLRRLDMLVADDDDTPAPAMVIAAITGAAGVGKTAVAVRWAHQAAERFPDGQLFVDLRGYTDGPAVDPVQVLGGILRALGVPNERIPSDADEAGGLYRSLLHRKRFLVLADNANGVEQVRPLLPASPGSQVLVTSRDRLDGLVALDGAHRVDIDVLTAEEAQSLLAQLLSADRVDAEPGETAKLAAACGYLPLALRIAAANFGSHAYQTIGQYVVELTSGDRLGALEVIGDPHSGVRAAFDLSYCCLTPDSRQLFRFLGLLPGPDITAEGAAALIGRSRHEAVRLLNELCAEHLVTEHKPGRYFLHDLMRQYAMRRALAEESQEQQDEARRRLGAF